MLKRLLLIALFIVGSSVLYAQSSGSGSSQGTQDQPGASGQQGTQQDQPGSYTGSTTSDQSGSSNTGSGTSNDGTATQSKTVTGKISKIDHKNNTIIVKDDTTKETQQFTLSSSATMTKDGSSITNSDLKKGDHVTLEVDGQNMVQRIDVMSKSSNKSGESKH